MNFFSITMRVQSVGNNNDIYLDPICVRANMFGSVCVAVIVFDVWFRLGMNSKRGVPERVCERLQGCWACPIGSGCRCVNVVLRVAGAAAL